MSQPGKRKGISLEAAVDAATLLGALAYLLVRLHPDDLISRTIAAGGDTPSHYYPLLFLKEKLLPHGHLSGWCQGSLAGFPIFQNYFPLPFLIMIALSAFVALPVAFKLGTVLGILLLPLAAYAGLRAMGQRFPVPAFGAAAVLPFLFMEANSAWGGNIPSTLAGEFCYSLSLALTVAWLGTLYAGISSRRWLVANALLLACIGLCHGYPLLFAGCCSLFFLLEREEGPQNTGYLITMHSLAILLFSFWLVPMLVGLPWTTPFSLVWVIQKWQEVLPKILWPIAALAVVALAAKPRRAVLFLLFAQACGWYLYGIALELGTVDCRFIPFVQITWALLAAVGLGFATQRLKGQALLPVIVLLAACAWSDINSKTIPYWLRWNYSGFEQKSTWPVLSGISRSLHGSESDPRVIYEHASRNNQLGSLRVWESLPLFSGRSTLEHAYLQASPASPFVFYLQSEVSREVSCPFPQYACTSMDFRRAKQHLRLFNVRDLILISDEAKAKIAAVPGYSRGPSFGPYTLYQISGPHRYVEPLPYEPVLWTGGNWKQTAYTWFRNLAYEDVTLIFPEGLSPSEIASFSLRSSDLHKLPRQAVFPSPASVANEKLTEEEISFDASDPHVPYLIKVSYDPHWTVEGADRIYLATPAFMVVYPTQTHVTLRYKHSRSDKVGLILTLFGVGAALWIYRRGLPDAWRRLTHNRYAWGLALGSSLVLGSWLGWQAFALGRAQPGFLLRRGIHYRDVKQWTKAEGDFQRIVNARPSSRIAEDALYYLATVYFLQEKWQPTLRTFERLLTEFPDTGYRPEAYFHLAICCDKLNRVADRDSVINDLLKEYPGNQWTAYTLERFPRPKRRP